MSGCTCLSRPAMIEREEPCQLIAPKFKSSNPVSVQDLQKGRRQNKEDTIPDPKALQGPESSQTLPGSSPAKTAPRTYQNPPIQNQPNHHFLTAKRQKQKFRPPIHFTPFCALLHANSCMGSSSELEKTVPRQLPKPFPAGRSPGRLKGA